MNLKSSSVSVKNVLDLCHSIHRKKERTGTHTTSRDPRNGTVGVRRVIVVDLGYTSKSCIRRGRSKVGAFM